MLPQEVITKRFKAYARMALAVDATAKALQHRETISAQEFERKVGPAVAKLKVSSVGRKDIWTVFNTILSETKFTEDLFAGGKTAAELAVEVDGKVLHVHITKDPNKPGEFHVHVGQYYLDSNQDLMMNPITSEPIQISLVGRLFVARDPSTGIEVTQSKSLHRHHNLEAILATVGKELKDGEITDLASGLPDQSIQLITAGTGSGKSGILGSSAL